MMFISAGTCEILSLRPGLVSRCIGAPSSAFCFLTCLPGRGDELLAGSSLPGNGALSEMALRCWSRWDSPVYSVSSGRAFSLLLDFQRSPVIKEIQCC